MVKKDQKYNGNEKKHEISGSRRRPPKKSTKNDLPEAPRDPPGAPREGQERPKRRQEGPKKAPRAAKSPPKSRSEAVLEGPGRPPGVASAPKRLQEGILGRFWSHLGSMLASFWIDFGFILGLILASFLRASKN